jgi:hypothetical protein
MVHFFSDMESWLLASIHRWSRITNLETKKKTLILLGIPISRMLQDMSGAMFQI